ncbi:MAG TPA: TPM domain-containing protein, partial [Candidatus Limnocylindrales bacterium]|nr:TPM domain-containing protein [Candidatus Limnocylindrales bacterium]
MSTAVRFLFLAVLLGGLALAFGLSLLAPGKAKPSLAAYPSPVPGQVVYDTAEVLGPQTEAQATATIQGIAARTGAQVIVYTQVKPESDTPEAAQADADALGTQWGVGRKGFDDGLVILFDLDESKCHGQVQLDAGSGYAAAFLSNDERQQIYEDDMLPLLRDCDLDGALLTALAKVDANATPDHARNLTLARQANAVVGLLGAPIVFLALAGWAFFHWRRYGRDPVYLDDPSILMPAPPPDLTAAGAALLIEGRSTRRALTTALVDLASRGRIAFEPQQHLLGKENVAIHVLPGDTRPSPEALRARRGPSGEAEAYVLGRLQSLAGEGGLIEPDELLALGKDVGTFDSRLEATAVGRGWFSQPPTAATRRWTGYGVIELVGAALVLVGGLNVPSSGLVLLAVGLGAAGIVTLALGQVMPART